MLALSIHRKTGLTCNDMRVHSCSNCRLASMSHEGAPRQPILTDSAQAQLCLEDLLFESIGASQRIFIWL